jgi:hypothetical protein
VADAATETEPGAVTVSEAASETETEADAEAVAVAAADAATASDTAAAPDRTRRRGRPDAGVALAAAPAPVDAAPAAADVIPAVPLPRPPETGRVVIAMDAWCDLVIDGTPHGRADRRKPITLWAGRHEIVCSQGPGLGEWRGRVTVVAGEEHTVNGSVLRPVDVRVAVEDGDAVVIDGTTVRRSASTRLPPGRYRIQVVRGGREVAASWVWVPRVASCQLRDRPILDCYRDDAR